MNLLKQLQGSVWIAVLISYSVVAQPPMSLEECVEIALENNHAIRIVKNQQRISTQNFSRGNAGLLPTVDVRSQFSGNINNSRQQLADGSEISQSGIHNTTANAALQANWTLYEGNRARIRYKQLETLKQSAELNTRISMENLVARLASEYYYFIQQKQLLSNLQYAVDLSKERVRIEKEHFLLGSGSKVTLLQAQVNLNADSSRLERQYEVLSAARIRINEVMAVDDLETRFIAADSIITVNPALVYDELLRDVVMHNTAISQALKNRQISRYDLDMIRTRSYPYLNLGSGYGYTRNTFQSGTLDNQQTWGMNYGLTLGINIYDGYNRRREQSNARIELENREILLEQAQQEVTADLLTIFNAYSNNLRLLDLETQNLEVSRENVDIAFERYRLGELSGFELREVQKNLLEAEERLLSIQYQAKMAEISLLQISGRILNEL